MKYKRKFFNYSINFTRKNGAILKKNVKICLYIAQSWGQIHPLSLYQDHSCKGNESVSWILLSLPHSEPVDPGLFSALWTALRALY